MYVGFISWYLMELFLSEQVYNLIYVIIFTITVYYKSFYEYCIMTTNISRYVTIF